MVLQLLGFALAVAPIAGVAYYMNHSPKTQKSVDTRIGDTGEYIPRNNWVYLEQPLTTQRAIPGDGDQISLERPLGPVQQSMSEQTNPLDALSILATHEASKDRAVMSLWTEFFKPTREITTRRVDQPITNVHILKPGSLVDQAVQHGNRFWDQPVPRSTGTDRYYKRDITVPWYLVP